MRVWKPMVAPQAWARAFFTFGSGVDPIAVYEVQQIIAELKRKGLGILVTDHNVRETLSIVDRAYLICEGKVEREGTSQFLIDDPKSRELYLGPRFRM